MPRAVPASRLASSILPAPSARATPDATPPPNAPAESLASLRTAVTRLNADKAFADDALKTIGFVPEYVAGPDTNRQVRTALVVKPEIRAFVLDYIKNAHKQ